MQGDAHHRQHRDDQVGLPDAEGEQTFGEPRQDETGDDEHQREQIAMLEGVRHDIEQHQPANADEHEAIHEGEQRRLPARQVGDRGAKGKRREGGQKQGHAGHTQE